MGVLFILDDLFVWLPLRGLWFIVEEIQQRVGGDAPSEVSRLQKRLLELRLRFELDEIGEAEYEQAAEEVIQRLRALQIGERGNDHVDGD